jgi:hypothetical protein
VICPKCGRPVNESAVICPGCDFILDTDFLGGDILDEEHQLRPGQGGVDPAVFNLADAVILGNIGDDSSSFETSDSGFHIKQDLGAARLYVSGRSQAVMSPDAVIATIETNVKNVRLTPFEKHVLRFIDGKRAVESIRVQAGLDEAEVKTALATLADKGVVKVVGRALADPDFDVETAPGQAPKRPARRMRGTLVGAVVVVGDDADQAIDDAFRTQVRADVPAAARGLELRNDGGDVFSAEGQAPEAHALEPSRTNEVRPRPKPPTSSTATIRPLQGRAAVNAGGGARAPLPAPHVPVLSEVDQSELGDASVDDSSEQPTVTVAAPSLPSERRPHRPGKAIGPGLGLSVVNGIDSIEGPKVKDLADSRVMEQPPLAAPPPLLSAASHVSAFGDRVDSRLDSRRQPDVSGSVWGSGTHSALTNADDGLRGGKRDRSTSLSSLLDSPSVEPARPAGRHFVADVGAVERDHDDFDSSEEPTSVRAPPVRRDGPMPPPVLAPSPALVAAAPGPQRDNAADQLFSDDDDGTLDAINAGRGDASLRSLEAVGRDVRGGESADGPRAGDHHQTGHTSVRGSDGDHTLSPSKVGHSDDATGLLEEDEGSGHVSLPAGGDDDVTGVLGQEDEDEDEEASVQAGRASLQANGDDDVTGVLEQDDESDDDGDDDGRGVDGGDEDSAWSSSLAGSRQRRELAVPEPSRLDSRPALVARGGRSTGLEEPSAGSGSSEIIASSMVVRPKLQVSPLALSGRKPTAKAPAPTPAAAPVGAQAVAPAEDDDLMVDPDATQALPALPKSVEGEARRRRREQAIASSATGSLPPSPPAAGANRRAPTDDMRKKARQLFEQASQDYAIGRVGAARMNAKLATIYDPDNEEYRRVLADWERPSGEQPSRPEYVALYEQAQACEDADDIDGAIDVLHKGLRLAPNPAAFHNRIGVLLAMRKRDYDGARDEIQKAIALEPDNAHYRNNLGKVMAKASRRRGDAFVH